MSVLEERELAEHSTIPYFLDVYATSTIQFYYI